MLHQFREKHRVRSKIGRERTHTQLVSIAEAVVSRSNCAIDSVLCDSFAVSRTERLAMRFLVDRHAQPRWDILWIKWQSAVVVQITFTHTHTLPYKLRSHKIARRPENRRETSACQVNFVIYSPNILCHWVAQTGQWLSLCFVKRSRESANASQIIFMPKKESNLTASAHNTICVFHSIELSNLKFCDLQLYIAVHVCVLSTPWHATKQKHT